MSSSPRAIPERGRVASAWVLSVVGHLVGLGLSGLVLAGSLSARKAALPPASPAPPAQEDTVEVELPTVVDGSLIAAPAVPSEMPALPAMRGGGEAMPRPDSGRAGRGGDDTSPDPALNLADRDEQMLLSPEVLSRLDRSQIQRIRSAKERASREDWRASREPMELTFVAMGRSHHPRPERRTPSDADPSAGARDHGAPQRVGGVLGAQPLPPGLGASPRQEGVPVEGGPRAMAGLGVRDGAPGNDHRESADAAHARPMVQEGVPSVPANVQDKPKDNVDSEQEVAARLQSIVHASSAGGQPGPGAGGQAGPGAPGSGGNAGPGSVAKALGTGVGSGVDADLRDRRRNEYLRQVIAKVYPHTANAMPKGALIDGAQGVVIVTLTILVDGSVASAAVTRSSGIPELDENSRRAVLRAAPFAPLPPELGPTLRWAMPMDYRNPAVRPRSASSKGAAP